MKQLNKFCDFSRKRKLGYWISPKKKQNKKVQYSYNDSL